ncbi:MAG: hypothetical protein V7K57_00315 [Nostoc sp.]
MTKADIAKPKHCDRKSWLHRQSTAIANRGYIDKALRSQIVVT